MRTKALITLGIMLVVSGCTSGLSCKNTMGGTRCANIQTVYEQSVLGAGAVIPESAPEPAPIDQDEKKQVRPRPLTEKEQIVSTLVTGKARPIRIPTIVLRIWTAPWEDQDGDLHQSGYVYCEINEKRGRWLFGESAVDIDSGYNVHRPSIEAPKADPAEAAPPSSVPTPKQPIDPSAAGKRSSAPVATRPFGMPPPDNNTLKLSK